MKSALKRLWREPLLHFLLLGFSLFLYYELTTDTEESPPKRIHVERGQVQQLAANFERTWLRPPTAEELDAMVEGHVREEVFYREALAMGLDRDDPLVRRRLRMKLEFMLEDLASQDVDDSVLTAYLQENAGDFLNEAKLSFTHVFLNPDQRPDPDADAVQLLARLKDGADPAALGDPTLAPRFYQLARRNEIARDFGNDFVAEIVALPTGTWTGPVYSPFGAHLIKIENRIDTRLPALVEVRDRVLREYQAGQRKEQKNLAYQKLRETYEIKVEPLLDSNSAGTGLFSEARAGESK